MIVFLYCLIASTSCSKYSAFADDKNEAEKFFHENRSLIVSLVNTYNESPVSYFGIEGDRIRLRVFDPKHDSLLYNFDDVQIKENEVVVAFNRIGWSNSHLNKLKDLMNKLHCSSVLMIPYDNGPSEPSPLLITCNISNHFTLFDTRTIGFEVHHNDFNSARTAWIKNHLEDERRGGFVAANVLWHYID